MYKYIYFFNFGNYFCAIEIVENHETKTDLWSESNDALGEWFYS